MPDGTRNPIRAPHPIICVRLSPLNKISGATARVRPGPELWAGGFSDFVNVRRLTPDVPRIRMQAAGLGQERRGLASARPFRRSQTPSRKLASASAISAVIQGRFALAGPDPVRAVQCEPSPEPRPDHDRMAD